MTVANLPPSCFQWLPEIREHCPTQPIMVVGCGTDMRTDETVLARLTKKGQTPVTYDQVRYVRFI